MKFIEIVDKYDVNHFINVDHIISIEEVEGSNDKITLTTIEKGESKVIYTNTHYNDIIDMINEDLE